MTDQDPELAEDLRRAQPNPPMTTPLADPTSEMDLGYEEDVEKEDRWDGETRGTRVPAHPTDPLEAEREEPARPGSTPGE